METSAAFAIARETYIVIAAIALRARFIQLVLYIMFPTMMALNEGLGIEWCGGSARFRSRGGGLGWS
jgi:hypothetical protein